MTADSTRSLFREAVKTLKPVVGDDARNDARLLLAHVLASGNAASGRPDISDEAVSNETANRFRDLVRQRLKRKPVSRIVGYRHFWKGRFVVTDDVLDPRPETERLVETALRGPPFDRVLDLGTGSGCILGSLLSERPAATGVGVDVSPGAIQVASENLAELEVLNRAELYVSDWFSAVTGQFDLIVSNPPYVASSEVPSLEPDVRFWDPARAILGGADGLECYRRIAAGLETHLKSGGRVLLEVGASQARPVCTMFRAACDLDCRIFKDLDRFDRVVRLERRKRVLAEKIP